MVDMNLNQHHANEEVAIVWMPFVVRKADLQSPLTTASMPYPPQPIPVHEVQRDDPPALLPAATGPMHADQKPRKGMASPKQKQFILEIVNRLNMAKDEMQRELGTRDIEQVTNAQANAFISKFKDAKPVF
jgi:hypothetical protein